jgi:hypothetical protein
VSQVAEFASRPWTHGVTVEPTRTVVTLTAARAKIRR